MRLMLSRMRSPIRRVLALDAGSRCIRMLLAQSEFGHFRLLKEEFIDLQEEGLVAADEIKAWLEERLREWGDPPLALALPQHLSNSQVIELPPAAEEDVAKLIEDETLKLSGVSDTRIIYDFVRIENGSKDRQHFWVTLCREEDIREKILKLVTAYLRSAPDSGQAVLVHAGAQSTVLAIIQRGQGAFASTFQMGGDFFTRTLARARSIPEEAADKLKRESDLLNGASASNELRAAVDGWAAELKRQLHDWFQHHPEAGTSFPMFASGGTFEQPGLFEYLKSKRALELKPWPKQNPAGNGTPSKGFEGCYGTALQALGYSPQAVSLLPPDYRLRWQKRLGRERVEIASLFLLIVCTLLLALGSWRQLVLVSRKQNFLNKLQSSQVALEMNQSLSAQLVSEYETVRPLFARQQNTLDILNSLALLQQTRSNRSFWYVLLADQQSYFNAPRTFNGTNKVFVLSPTNSPPATLSTLAISTPSGTNASPAKPGLIAELSVPDDSEAARILLSQLVRTLKQQPLFSKVDLLSDDLRRNLADPKVMVPDRDFVLAIDFAAGDFQPSSRLKKPAALTNRTATKRAARQAQPAAESADAPGSSAP